MWKKKQIPLCRFVDSPKGIDKFCSWWYNSKQINKTYFIFSKLLIIKRWYVGSIFLYKLVPIQNSKSRPWFFSFLRHKDNSFMRHVPSLARQGADKLLPDVLFNPLSTQVPQAIINDTFGSIPHIMKLKNMLESPSFLQ